MPEEAPVIQTVWPENEIGLKENQRDRTMYNRIRLDRINNSIYIKKILAWFQIEFT